MSKEIKRKMKRIEKKKKKIAAFLQVSKLNEDDRKTRKGTLIGDDTDSVAQCSVDDPASKKAKPDDSVIINESATKLLAKEVLQDSDQKHPDLTHQNPNYANEDIHELRRLLRERRKRFSQLPKFRLKESGELASLYMTEDHRIPLFMVDIQHLIMWSLLGHHAPFSPSRWYQLIKFNRLSHTVVLAVDGISVNDLESASGFLSLPSQPRDGESDALGSAPKNLFPWKLEFIGPLSYGSNLVQEIAAVPLSNTQYDKVIRNYGSIEKALKSKAVYKVFRTLFPVLEQVEGLNDNDSKKDVVEEAECTKEEAECTKEEAQCNTKDKFPRTDLLLSADQMVIIGYPLPLVKASDGVNQPLDFPNIINEAEAKIAGSVGALIQSAEFRKNSNNNQDDAGSSYSDDSCDDLVDQEDGNDNSEIEADDERYIFSKPLYKEVGPNSPMFALDCEMCQTGSNRSELTRISIVNEDLEVVYESLVKPYRRITNYLTRFSGITEKMLRGVKTRLKDVQEAVRNLLPPDAILVGQSLNFDLHAMKIMHPYVIDTSVAYNLSGERSRRTKLATLSRLFLSEDIQCAGAKGHDPFEDASAAMKLILLKLSQSIHYGDAVLSKQLARQEAVLSKQLEKKAPASTKAKKRPRQERLAKDLEMGENGEKAYATSIFSHVKRGKHAAAVVGVKGAISEYELYIDQKAIEDRVDCSLSEEKPPNLLGFEHSSEAITCALEIMQNHQLCIVHIDKDSVGEKLKSLKKWCKKIVECSAPSSLCIVVLGGTEHVNGACLINLKDPSVEVT